MNEYADSAKFMIFSIKVPIGSHADITTFQGDFVTHYKLVENDFFHSVYLLKCGFIGRHTQAGVSELIAKVAQRSRRTFTYFF